MMRLVLMIFSILFTVFSGCVTSRTAEQKLARNLQKGRVVEDTSYVYALPFEAGNSHLVVQGYFSALSHKNRAAIDFKMKKGTKITAARDGVVIRAIENNSRGGWSAKNRPYANFVIVQHIDGSRAGYWHLQQDGVLVNVGDTVKTGQVIALSGKTGYSAMPHLHFMVWNSRGGQWSQVPTRFSTTKGIKYLKPMKCHGH